MSGSPKMTNRLPLPVFFEIVGHVEVSVHACLEHGDSAKFVELRSVGVVVEGTGHQHVEVSVSGFTHCRYEIGARDCAEFRADEDASTFLRA